MPKTYTKDKTAFLKVKQYLDGAVFWRDVPGNKVEIKMAAPSKRIKEIIASIAD